jgi:hypothetical protein
MWFDWSDREAVWEAIESAGLMQITARVRPVVVVGFEGDGDILMSQLAKIVQEGHDCCIVIDARHHLDEIIAQIVATDDDETWYHVLGVARLDVADRSTFQGLMTAVECHWDRSWPHMPHVEFCGIK